MDGRADGNHAQREHIARPDGLRTEDTEIDGIVAVLLLLVLHHMAVALHGIACHESIRSKNVTQTLCLAVLNQRNVGAASGVILDTHDLLLTRLPAVKVDEAQAASVATTAATDRNVAVVVPSARFALSHRELTHRLAAVQVWIQRVPQPPNRGRDRLEHLELLVRSDVRRDFVFLNAQSSSNGIFLAVLAHAQLLLLLEPTTLAARPHAAHIFRSATGVPSACTATDAPDPSRSSGWTAGAARAVEIAACCHMPRCMHTRTGIDMPRANDDMLDAAIGAWQEAAAVFSSHDIT